jgi:hypothetical protein
MARFLILFGIMLVVAGLAWPWLTQLGLGRLPGDIRIERDGFTIIVPLMSCLIVSAVISLILWLLGK